MPVTTPPRALQKALKEDHKHYLDTTYSPRAQQKALKEDQKR